MQSRSGWIDDAFSIKKKHFQCNENETTIKTTAENSDLGATISIHLIMRLGFDFVRAKRCAS